MLTEALGTNDEVIGVEALKGLPRRERPRLRCPECGETITARLGLIKRPHFAHRPGSQCPTTTGEGQRHLRAKAHLVEELRKLVANQRTLAGEVPCECGSIQRCNQLLSFQGDEEVHSERWMDRKTRPDVTITRAGKDIAYLEVVVTNPCDSEKWSRYYNSGAKVLEVGSGALLSAEQDVPEWFGDTPIKALRQLHFSPSPCEVCTIRQATPPTESKVSSFRSGRPSSHLPNPRRNSATAIAPVLALGFGIQGFRSLTMSAGTKVRALSKPSCIGCGDRLWLNRSAPYCKACFASWRRKGGSPVLREAHCHGCGSEVDDVCFSRPFCGPCYAADKRSRGGR